MAEKPCFKINVGDVSADVVVAVNVLKSVTDLTTKSPRFASLPFKTLNELELTGTDSSLNGTKGIFFASSNPELSRHFRTRFAIPSYFAFDSDSFDNTVTNFAQTNKTFDDTTP